jgi:hypothetical protein
LGALTGWSSPVHRSRFQTLSRRPPQRVRDTTRQRADESDDVQINYVVAVPDGGMWAPHSGTATRGRLCSRRWDYRRSVDCMSVCTDVTRLACGLRTAFANRCREGGAQRASLTCVLASPPAGARARAPLASGSPSHTTLVDARPRCRSTSGSFVRCVPDWAVKLGRPLPRWRLARRSQRSATDRLLRGQDTRSGRWCQPSCLPR